MRSECCFGPRGKHGFVEMLLWPLWRAYFRESHGALEVFVVRSCQGLVLGNVCGNVAAVAVGSVIPSKPLGFEGCLEFGDSTKTFKTLLPHWKTIGFCSKCTIREEPAGGGCLGAERSVYRRCWCPIVAETAMGSDICGKWCWRVSHSIICSSCGSGWPVHLEAFVCRSTSAEEISARRAYHSTGGLRVFRHSGLLSD
jgi:hypothetical protein